MFFLLKIISFIIVINFIFFIVLLFYNKNGLLYNLSLWFMIYYIIFLWLKDFCIYLSLLLLSCIFHMFDLFASPIGFYLFWSFIFFQLFIMQDSIFLDVIGSGYYLSTDDYWI